jgi:hypothetical protein
MKMQWMEQFRFKCSASSCRRWLAVIALLAVPPAVEVERQRRFKFLIYDEPSGVEKSNVPRGGLVPI